MHWEQLLRLTNGKVSFALLKESVTVLVFFPFIINICLEVYCFPGCGVVCVVGCDVCHQLVMPTCAQVSL